MSDLKFRRQTDAPAPRYPAADADGKVSPPPMISNASLALAPLVLIAAVPAWSSVPVERPKAVACDRGQDPQPSPTSVERLTETEVSGLIDDVVLEKPMRGPMMRGAVAVQSAYLTETEAKALLAAFLKKNGFAAAAGKLGDIEMDAADTTKRVGVKVVRDAGDGLLDEVALLKARGEARVLVVNSRSLEYDREGHFAGRLPTKRGAAYALLAELERLLNE